MSENSSPDTTSDVAAGIFYWGINAPDQVAMIVRVFSVINRIFSSVRRSLHYDAPLETAPVEV